MPTYVNNTTSKITESFQNQNGSLVSFEIDSNGGTLKTPYILVNAGLTKTSDAPFYNPLEALTQTVEAEGAGDETVQIDLDTKVISIYNTGSAVVLAYINSKANTPALFCHASSERLISVGHNVNQLIFTFTEAGVVYVEERK